MKAVVFSTSWISKHSVDLIKKGLAEAGIPVAEEFIYAKNKPNEDQLNEAKRIAKKYITEGELIWRKDNFPKEEKPISLP